MIKSVSQVFRALHRDEMGMSKEEVIGLALIAIPLLMLLITFSKEIGDWLKSAFGSLKGAPKVPGSI